jgi:Fe-S-cluster-containing hydrogenase component 2
MTNHEELFNSGILADNRPGVSTPPNDIWNVKKNGLVIVECPQRIPCNPCNTSCAFGAILPFEDINDVPQVNYEKCTGCGVCVAVCPGLACFVVDMTFEENKALYKLPYEMLPVPQKGDVVDCLGRFGEVVSKGTIEMVTEPRKDRTLVVHVSAPRKHAGEIRAIRAVN